MIISCPECAKNYRIAEEKISTTGLKVRCSNCAFVWRVVKNSFSEQLTPVPIPVRDIAEPTPPQPKIKPFIPAQPQSRMRRFKIDWVVLTVGVILFLTILLLDILYAPHILPTVPSLTPYFQHKSNPLPTEPPPSAPLEQRYSNPQIPYSHEKSEDS